MAANSRIKAEPHRETDCPSCEACRSRLQKLDELVRIILLHPYDVRVYVVVILRYKRQLQLRKVAIYARKLLLAVYWQTNTIGISYLRLIRNSYGWP